MERRIKTEPLSTGDHKIPNDPPKLELKTEKIDFVDVVEIDDRIFSPDFSTDQRDELSEIRCNSNSDVNDAKQLNKIDSNDDILVIDEIIKEEPVFYDAYEAQVLGNFESLQDVTLSSRNEDVQNVTSTVSTEKNAIRRRKKRALEKKMTSNKCSYCQRQFKTKSHVLRHERVHTGDKPFQCSICYKTFNQKHSLDTHQSIHTGEKPFKCNQCEKKFRLKQHLFLHARVHSSDNSRQQLLKRMVEITKPEQQFEYRIYECYLCRYRGHVNHVKVHIKSEHTAEKLSECKICFKKFTLKRSLQSHQVLHQSKRMKFECDLCGRKYSHRDDLRKHLESHKNSFKCSDCKKTFPRKSALKAHLKLHTGFKPFKCLVCEKTFAKNGCLTRHSRVHTKERPFKCDICEMKFSRNHLLTDHKHKIHKQIMEID